MRKYYIRNLSDGSLIAVGAVSEQCALDAAAEVYFRVGAVRLPLLTVVSSVGISQFVPLRIVIEGER
jgi:hypothetical protein